MDKPTTGGLMRRLTVALVLVMLAACTYTYRWTLPPGGSDQQLQEDHAACARDAEKAAEGLAGTNEWTVYEQCMTAKGYAKAGGGWR
ncbi:MAG TPA: hypothetical protein VFV36_01180 [Candidatus Methylomirabilis sp.]|nr:hypothetical protein [Candidatus Methylomirabilis sp.]